MLPALAEYIMSKFTSTGLQKEIAEASVGIIYTAMLDAVDSWPMMAALSRMLDGLNQEPEYVSAYVFSVAATETLREVSS